MEGRGEITDTSGNDTEEWGEAKTKYAQLKEDLTRQISLSIGYEGIME